MGHANISITLDRYGHLVPGSEEEAASLLDSYLATQRERAEEQSRAAAPRDNRGIMVHISSGTRRHEPESKPLRSGNTSLSKERHDVDHRVHGRLRALKTA